MKEKIEHILTAREKQITKEETEQAIADYKNGELGFWKCKCLSSEADKLHWLHHTCYN